MRCPTCGFQIDQPNLERCPNCGNLLPTQSTQPTGENPPPPYYPYPQYQPSAQQPGQGSQGGTPQEPPSPYGAPQQPSGYPPSGYPPTTPGPYSQPLPSGGYGQPGPYSQPMQPGGYPQASPFSPAGYPQAQPPKKSRTGLIIGIVIGAVVLVLVCAAALVIGLAALATNTPQTGGPGVTVTSATVTAGAATPTPAQTVVYQETFASGANGWSDDTGHCFWKDGAYHAASGYECYAPIGEQTSLDLSAEVQQLSGETTVPYGLVFALDSSNNDYEFGIDSKGSWALFKCGPSSCDTAKDYTPSSAIHGGLNTTNKLEVVVTGTHFQFLVNDTAVGSFDDTSYTSGKVGLFTGDPSESAFNNFVVTRPN